MNINNTEDITNTDINVHSVSELLITLYDTFQPLNC